MTAWNAERRRQLGIGALMALALLALPGCGRESKDSDEDHAGEQAGAATEGGEAGEAEGAEAGKGAEEAEEAVPDTVTLSATAAAEAGIVVKRVELVAATARLSLNGTVSFDENRLLAVSSPVPGRVASLPFDLGAAVPAGAVVAWVESVELGRARQEYLRAATDLDIAQKSFDRAKLLVGEKAISEGEFQQREGDYLAKRAAVASAEAALRQMGDSPQAARPGGGQGLPRIALRAPFAATLTARHVTPGALVEAMHPLVTVANLDRLWVFFQAYEKDLAAIRRGLAVEVTTDAVPGERFPGTIDFVASEVSPESRTVRVRATVDNRDGKLRSGLFVRASIELPGSAGEQVLALPQGAIQTLEERPHVFLRIGPATFARRPIELGRSFDGRVEVVSGLRAGEEIVTEGGFVLKSEFLKASLAEDE